MTDYRAVFAKEIREALGEYNNEDKAVVVLVKNLVDQLRTAEQHIEKLQEENAYVNDMLENAHNRIRLLKQKYHID